MLHRVRRWIVDKKIASLLERLRQSFIDSDIAKRRTPRAAVHHRERLAHAGVIRAENDETLRKFDASVNCASNVARVHVSGMGRYTPNCADFRPQMGRVLIHITSQSVGASGIKLPSKRRFTHQ
jgi:hypothetical protein